MFKHISVHVVHVFARAAAKRVIQQQLRDDGVRVGLVPAREINDKATEYLHDHPEVWREAMERARQMDDEEEAKKARRRKIREPMVTPDLPFNSEARINRGLLFNGCYERIGATNDYNWIRKGQH